MQSGSLQGMNLQVSPHLGGGLVMRVPHPPSISQRFRSAHQRFIIGPMAAHLFSEVFSISTRKDNLMTIMPEYQNRLRK